MAEHLDAIPVLTDAVDAETEITDSGRMRRLADLEAQLTVVIHEYADELVHNACREMEALLLEQVSDRLKANLPALIARIVEEHFPPRGARG